MSYPHFQRTIIISTGFFLYLFSFYYVLYTYVSFFRMKMIVDNFSFLLTYQLLKICFTCLLHSLYAMKLLQQNLFCFRADSFNVV